MLDIKDFTNSDSQPNFDFKGFLIKIISNWQWFLLSLVLSFIIAYQVNIRQQKIYGIGTTVSLKEESNPFFNSNTSLVFNWGGSSDQIKTIMTILKSRTHNEIVVDKLNFFIDYIKKEDYFKRDAYGEVPFYVTIDRTKNQVLEQDIIVKFIDKNHYTIKIDGVEETINVINYYKNISEVLRISKLETATFKIGEMIHLPYLNWHLQLKDHFKPEDIGQEFIVKFNRFDQVVAQYQEIKVSNDEKTGSILNLSLEGTNKARLVDYLNETVNVLIKSELDRKNQFATNTIRFIDSTLAATDKELKKTNSELEGFQNGKNIYEIEDGGKLFSDKLQKIEIEKDEITRKVAYVNSLKNYLRTNDDFSRLPAPSVAGIAEPNIVVNVSKLITLSISRSQMAYTVKSDKLYKDFENEMESVKGVLLENINSYKNTLNYDLAVVQKKAQEAEASLKEIPLQEQGLAKIKRKFALNENIYNTFLAKKSEAEIVKAANLSDIKFVDAAKDIGGGLLGPKTEVNYVIAIFLGILLPFLILMIVYIINNKIQSVEDIERLTKIPIIGVIGKKQMNSNLAVFERPRSALTEGFRSIRSSLQFIYKKKGNDDGAKVLMITSSIGGEGKTFCSMNIATIFALSEKKTIIIGMDLRKPKIFEDFEIENKVGVVNYLIGQKNIHEIVQKSHIPYLDIITSGPIPPNPSELILGNAMKELIQTLKTQYDYIILDTPPVGLVTDALELDQFCDAALYVVRQNYTKKDMITVLNNRNQRGELNNLSVILNGFENKAKYGYAYGYGFDYGYGYGNSSGYHDDENAHQSIFQKILSYFKFKKGGI